MKKLEQLELLELQNATLKIQANQAQLIALKVQVESLQRDAARLGSENKTLMDDFNRVHQALRAKYELDQDEFFLPDGTVSQLKQGKLP